MRIGTVCSQNKIRADPAKTENSVRTEEPVVGAGPSSIDKKGKLLSSTPVMAPTNFVNSLTLVPE